MATAHVLLESVTSNKCSSTQPFCPPSPLCLSLPPLPLSSPLLSPFANLQEDVLLRAPFRVVYPVHNALELPIVLPDDAVQPPAPVLRLALPCVAGRDGHDAVAGLKPDLHDVHVLPAHWIVQPAGSVGCEKVKAGGSGTVGSNA